MLRLELLFLWTWSIVQYFNNEAIMFRELALLLPSGQNAIEEAILSWRREQSQIPKRSGFVFGIMNDGSSPEK
jgi:hypothetical protein